MRFRPIVVVSWPVIAQVYYVNLFLRKSPEKTRNAIATSTDVAMAFRQSCFFTAPFLL